VLEVVVRGRTDDLGRDPATTDPGGTVVFGVTTAPAATIEPEPMWAPFMTTLPMPTRTSSSTRAPCSTTRCPTVTPRPTVSGKPGSECRVQPSCTLVSVPITITSSSARATAPYQMLDRAPSVTAPTTTAVGATKASSSISGAPKCSSAM
jgi:hypothetical protein